MKYDNGAIELTGHEIKLLDECRSSDETSEHMTGIRIGSYLGKPSVAATDGYRVVVLWCEGTYDGPEVNMPGPEFDAIKRTKVRETARIDPTALTLAVGGMVKPWSFHDRKFPPIEQAIPAHGPAGQASANKGATQIVGMAPEYLKPLVMLAKVTGPEVRLMPGAGKLDPIVWRADGNETSALYVLMPMRIS